MSAPTAAGLLRLLDKRKTQAAIAALGDLDDAGHDAVRRALTAVPAGSRIDVPVLLESVHRELTARAEAEAAKRAADAQPWRYALLLKSPRELLKLRDRLQAAADAGETTVEWPLPGSPGADILQRLDGIAANLRPAEVEQPDPDLDDEPRPRPKVRRLASRRLAQSAPRTADALESAHPAPASAEPASARVPGRPASRLGRVLGPRCFVDGEDTTPEPVDHFPPPWVLPAEGEAHDAA